MNVFYTNYFEKNTAILDENESHHCIKVLRMKRGEAIHFIDGRGGLYKGIILDDNPRACRISIQDVISKFEKRPYYLHIAIAPTKNSDRYDWFVEKSCEIGIDKITPIICDHSERKTIRIDRLEKIALSAAKQSYNSWLTNLEPLMFFSDFIRQNHSATDNFIAHCGAGERTFLLKNSSLRSSYLVLIGPEGDFSDKEVEMAVNHDFMPVSLGNSRLRTETAGVVTAQIIADMELLKNIMG